MNQPIFQFQQRNDVLILVPVADLRELEFDRLEEGAESVLKLLSDGSVRHLVIDFQHTDYYGSTALSFFVKLWKRVKCGNGQMILCGVSSHEKEILKITHLDGLWQIVDTEEEALAEIAQQSSV